MNKRIMLLVLLCSYALVLFLSGCGNKYAKAVDRLCPANTTRQSAMTASENALEDMHFTIEKFDAEAGLIKTAPMQGAQSFEFWRSDSVGSFNQAEADLQSIRRIIEINVTEQDGKICINCKATTQRLSMPQGISAEEQDYGSLVKSRRSVQQLGPTSKQKANICWINLGRDNQLETEIIKRIEKKIASIKK